MLSCFSCTKSPALTASTPDASKVLDQTTANAKQITCTMGETNIISELAEQKLDYSHLVQLKRLDLEIPAEYQCSAEQLDTLAKLLDQTHAQLSIHCDVPSAIQVLVDQRIPVHAIHVLADAFVPLSQFQQLARALSQQTHLHSFIADSFCVRNEDYLCLYEQLGKHPSLRVVKIDGPHFDNKLHLGRALELVLNNRELEGLALRKLNLELGCGQETTKILCSIGTLAKLRQLELHLCQLNQEHVHSVCTELLKGAAPLEVLDLSWNAIFGDHPLPTSLLAVLSAGQLKEINLEKCEINSGQALQLLRLLDQCPALTALKLGRQELGPGVAEALSRFIRESRTLETLHLQDCRLGTEGCNSLVGVIETHPSLRTVALAGNLEPVSRTAKQCARRLSKIQQERGIDFRMDFNIYFNKDYRQAKQFWRNR